MTKRAKDLMQKYLIDAMREAIEGYYETSNEDFRKNYILAIGEIGHHLCQLNNISITEPNKEVNNGDN